MDDAVLQLAVITRDGFQQTYTDLLEMAEKGSRLARGVPLACHFIILFPCSNDRPDEPINSDTAIRAKMSLANSCLPGHRIIHGLTIQNTGFRY